MPVQRNGGNPYISASAIIMLLLQLIGANGGGNALFSISKALHRVIEKGSDSLKLGRWNWTKFRGRDNHVLKVYCAYCPNPPSGPLSVFAQQQNALLRQQDSRNPQVAFAQDICQDINESLARQELYYLLTEIVT
jgi:hypothetical protein